MLIPTQVRVGQTDYAVRIENPGRLRYGSINYQECIIRIHPATPAKRKPLTFWHELTHAILFDMHHPLESSEVFVDAFARRLDKAIKSARFA